MTDVKIPDEPGVRPPLPSSARLLDAISVRLSVEFGSARIRLRDLLEVDEGGVIVLDNDIDAPLAIYANNTLLGHGEVVKSGQRFGIRIIQISDPEQRLASARPDTGAAA